MSKGKKKRAEHRRLLRPPAAGPRGAGAFAQLRTCAAGLHGGPTPRSPLSSRPAGVTSGGRVAGLLRTGPREARAAGPGLRPRPAVAGAGGPRGDAGGGSSRRWSRGRSGSWPSGGTWPRSPQPTRPRRTATAAPCGWSGPRATTCGGAVTVRHRFGSRIAAWNTGSLCWRGSCAPERGDAERTVAEATTDPDRRRVTPPAPWRSATPAGVVPAGERRRGLVRAPRAAVRGRVGGGRRPRPVVVDRVGSGAEAPPGGRRRHDPRAVRDVAPRVALGAAAGADRPCRNRINPRVIKRKRSNGKKKRAAQ